MRYAQLGTTGLEVSVVSFGTSPLGDMFGVADEDAGIDSVHRALDAGINFFDSSVYYGGGLAESRLAKALGSHRDEVVIGTKAGRFAVDEFDFRPERIRASLQQSLRLLGTDRVEIFQLHDIEHVPMGPVFEDSYAELVKLRDEGLCRFIGMTGYPVAALRRAVLETDLDVVLCYAHATLLDDTLRTGLLPAAQQRGTGVINAAAVALGLLTPGPVKISSMSHPADEEILAATERVKAICAEAGVNVSSLANQYSIQRSGCATTLIGTVNPRHLDDAVAAVDSPIDEELLSRVLEAAADVRGRGWRSGLPENN
jgi:aryl-alcohol dehydrogenase-like predicted oxidoreductase